LKHRSTWEKRKKIMVKSTFARALLCLAILTAIGVTALALGNKQNIVTTDGGRVAIATKAPSIITPANVNRDAGYKVISSNLSDYPYGTYFCCYGLTISGISGQGDIEFWAAIPFTPSADVSVTKLEAAVGYIDTTNTNFDLGVYNDASGIPGTVIKNFLMADPSKFGNCCTLITAKDSAGIPVKAGTQYWLVVSTNDKKDPAFFGSWAINSTDMRLHPVAFYCNSSECAHQGWSIQSFLVPAYGVFGN